MLDILLDTIIDGLKMLPFLFGAYLLMEYIEHHSSQKMQNSLVKLGRFGALGGAVLGCFPQCGFSVAAANLYAGRIITAGTLVAVFLSTSDEAVPVLLSYPDQLGTIGQLLFLKVVVAMAAGLLLDFVLAKPWGLAPKKEGQQEAMEELCAHCHCDHGIVRSALRHTAGIWLFLLLFSFILNLGIQWLGEERLSLLLMDHSLFQPLIAGLLGFIPNCAASVLLVELYMAHTIGLGALVAGLCTGAGVGLVVLFKANRHWSENLKLLVYIYLISALAGISIHLLGW